MDIMDSKFLKVGDRVRIDGDLKGKINDNYLDIVEKMIQYENKIATIVDCDVYNVYMLDIDDRKWAWNHNLLHKIETTVENNNFNERR